MTVPVLIVPAPAQSLPLAQAPLPQSVASSPTVLPAATWMPVVWPTRMVLFSTTVLGEGQDSTHIPLPPPPLLRAMVEWSNCGDDPVTYTPQS